MGVLNWKHRHPLGWLKQKGNLLQAIRYHPLSERARGLGLEATQPSPRLLPGLLGKDHPGQPCSAHCWCQAWCVRSSAAAPQKQTFCCSSAHKRPPCAPALYIALSKSTPYTGALDKQSLDSMPAFHTHVGRWGNKYILASTLGSASPKYGEFSKHWKLFR